VVAAGVALSGGVAGYEALASDAGSYSYALTPGEAPGAGALDFVLLDWTTGADGRLAGHLRTVVRSPVGELNESTVQLAGHQDGPAVEFATTAQGVPQHGHGLLDGATLVLRVPDNHGGTVTYTLRHTTPEEFHQLVSDLRGQRPPAPPR
jgi:hypothetical protein